MEARLVSESAIESRYCVGRDAELERVRSLVHDAALQEGSALIWLGERGVGKTRFLYECAEIKAAATVVSVRCGAAAPFRPDLASQVAASLRLPSGGRVPRSMALLTALCGARDAARSQYSLTICTSPIRAKHRFSKR